MSQLGPTLGFAVLCLAVPALAVRAASLPLLVRAQRAVRRRELEVRNGSASPWVPSGAGVAELAAWAVGFIGMWAWVRTNSIPGFELMNSTIFKPHLHDLSAEAAVSEATVHTVFLGVVIPLLALWLLIWMLTQRKLLAGGLPAAGPWGASANGLRLAVFFLVRLTFGVFMPLGLFLAALLVQVVGLVVSWKVAAMDGSPGSGSPGSGSPAGAGGSGPVLPSPYAPTASAVQQRPVQTPAAAALAPAQPAASGYVPTQVAQGSFGAATSVSYQDLHPNEPRSIAGYHLIGRIGSGGMGTVYLARREGSATEVALKTIHPELLDHAELLKRFERESEVLAMVPGAYTARVLDAGVDAGRPYLAMELLDGQPLDVHLREQGPIRSAEALRALALALGTALSGVHRLGLVHRDLKPANIMLTTAGPRLLDFGIAALVDGTRLTRTGGGPGTLTYMAPEQFGDEPVGTAADVWAWACCVVCAAHGASPFQATSTGAVIRRIVDTGPEPVALAAVQALDPGLGAVVARALTADPAGRPADGAALVELLAAGGGDVRDQITRGWQTLVV